MKVVIVGQNQGRLDKIKTQLKPVKDILPELHISTSRPSYLETAIDENLSLLIFDADQINALVFPFIQQVRKAGYNGAVIMLGHLPDNFDMCDVAEIKNLLFIKKPYQEEQLAGMVHNCLNTDSIRQRRDQRFDVKEQATLEAYSSDFKTETLINNISRSGVRIEGNLRGLQKGDLLRLRFNFEKINKERLMSARVVWVKKEGDNKEEAGLEFVSQKAVYEFLLDHAVA